MNNCARDGFLVDATSPLTVDPTDPGGRPTGRRLQSRALWSLVTSHGVELARAAPDRIEELFDSFSQFPQGVPIRALRERIRHALSTE